MAVESKGSHVVERNEIERSTYSLQPIALQPIWKDFSMEKKLDIYKRGQGKYTRLGTIIAVMFVATIGAYVLSRELQMQAVWIRYLVPALVWIGVGVLVLWLANRPASADFLIATESEMKKVSWSSRKEIIGSTKVVIVFMIVIASILFGVDVMFVALFKLLHISTM